MKLSVKLGLNILIAILLFLWTMYMLLTFAHTTDLTYLTCVPVGVLALWYHIEHSNKNTI